MKDTYIFEDELPILVLEWQPVSEKYPLHWHTCLEIGYCTTGKGWFYFSDKTYEARGGDIFIVNNVEKHMTRSDAQDPNHYYFVKFDISVLDQSEKELLLPFVYDPERFTNRIARDHPTAQQISQLIQTMWEESQARRPGYRLLLRSTLITICVLLLRHFEHYINGKDWNHTVNQFSKLQTMLSYVQQHYREPLELSDVAEHVCLSPSRVYHLFKAMTGKGLKEYINMLRINEAKALLAETNLPTMEICYACGFQSHTPFYRAFKNIVEMTPQEYRERYSLHVLASGEERDKPA